MRLFIGLMSGTSMDGIDAALVDLASHTFIHGLICPYSETMRKCLHETLAKPVHRLSYFSQLNTLLGREFAVAANRLLAETTYQADDIIAIGSHGQTLCHDSTAVIPYTVQFGCPHTIAALTGISVVADFRVRDLIAGGQGAPLAPIYHQALFKEQAFPLAVVNIGGIANLSYLMNEEEVRGYDLGPGNCLMDAWTSHHLKRPYDENGQWAQRGRVIDGLLEALLSDEYFQRSAPKSIGKEYFSLEWLQKYIPANKTPQDVQATLLHLTAMSIANGIKDLPHQPHSVFICGGGAHNQALLSLLRLFLPESRVNSTTSININPDFVEALMFAWLAEKTLNHRMLNLSSITGAAYPTILGAIYPAGIDKGILHRV